MSFADELTDALADIRGEFGAVATYLRGATAYELDPVSRGETAYRFSDEDGLSQRVSTVDWLFDKSAIGFDPRKGDRIQETLNETVYTYEVTSINNEPCWESHDPGQSQIRVHTQLIGTS